MFCTDDPEIIAKLDKRMVEVGDVYGPEEYNRRVMSHEQRENAYQQEIRQLREQNRLLSDLSAKGNIKAK
jgi:hypothetical protein